MQESAFAVVSWDPLKYRTEVKTCRYIKYRPVRTIYIRACSNTYHILRPAKAPGFSYAWLELVSHRVFIGRMLAITSQQRVSTEVAILFMPLYFAFPPCMSSTVLFLPHSMMFHPIPWCYMSGILCSCLSMALMTRTSKYV